jgi:hypothetical protein
LLLLVYEGGGGCAFTPAPPAGWSGTFSGGYCDDEGVYAGGGGGWGVMTGAVMFGPSSGDDPFLARSGALFFRTLALMWNCSLRSLKNKSRITAAPMSKATSKPL